MFNVRKYILEVYHDWGTYDYNRDRDDKKNSGNQDMSAYSDDLDPKNRKTSTIDLKKNIKSVRKNTDHAS